MKYFLIFLLLSAPAMADSQVSIVNCGWNNPECFGMAEVNDMPEGATLGGNTYSVESAAPKPCRIACPDTNDVTVNYEGSQAVIRGCENPIETDCN